MNKTFIFSASLIVSAIALTSCGSSSSSISKKCYVDDVEVSCNSNNTNNNDNEAVIGTASLSGSTFTANVDGEIYTATSNANVNGKPGFFGTKTINGTVYNLGSSVGDSSDYVAFSGWEVGGNSGFIGQSGTTATPTKNSGVVEYSGNYAAVYSAGSSIGKLVLESDFDNGTVSTSSGSLDIDGKIDGNSVTGTATFEGNKGDLEAGFYGRNELNGAATDGNNFAATFATTASE